MYGLIFFWVSIFFAAENQFDVNEIGFLKTDTLKTWVAEQFHDQKNLDQINSWLSKQVYGCPGYLKYSHTEVEPEKNNPHPGKTTFIFPGLYLPFLQEVHNAGKQKPLSIIDIGVAWGLKFWPLFYALTHEATVYANDLSTTVVKRFDEKIKECYPSSAHITIEKLFGIDCNTLINNPSLEGKMDFLLSENVCHLFNPSKHQEFLLLIHYLLKPSGKAFISAPTLNCKKMDRSDPVFLAYITAKNKEAIYPGFLQIILQAIYDQETQERLYFNILASETPSDNERCWSFKMSPELSLFAKDNGIVRKTYLTKTFQITNYMTPTIFRNAVLSVNQTKGTNLAVKDAFFLDCTGVRCEKFVPDAGIDCAAAIIQKN